MERERAGESGGERQVELGAEMLMLKSEKTHDSFGHDGWRDFSSNFHHPLITLIV
jgi:hypothetical protein